MASKTLNSFTDLYNQLNQGKITYEEFLDLTNPKNPDGIYGEIIGKMDKLIGSQEFINADKTTQAKIKKEREEILITGDSS